MEPELIADRACGTCNVCCVALTIDDPALQKHAGHRCRNAQADNGCSVYETRPHTCRAFYCGWRQFKWVKAALRPDRSGVLVQQHGAVTRETGEHRVGVIFTLTSATAPDAEGLAETVSAAVVAGLPVYVRVPGPPGYTAATARVDEALRYAVLARDRAAVLQVLREAWIGAGQANAEGAPLSALGMVRSRNTRPE